MPAHIPMIHWYPGHIAKVQPKLKELIKLCDVVVEVLDARMPLSSHFALADQLTQSKHRILVLNKTDLADRTHVTAAMKYWQAKGLPTVALTNTSEKGLQRLKDMLKVEAATMHARLAKRGILPRSLRLMVLGLPNVGKSSLINRMAKRRRAQVGDRPGVTRGTQWVRIAEGLELLDTPGLIPPKMDDPETSLKMALIGAVSTESYDPLEVARIAMEYLDEKVPGYLEEIGVPPTLEAYSAKRGFLKPGGGPDIERTSRTFLMDLRDGRFGPVSLDDLAIPEAELAALIVEDDVLEAEAEPVDETL
jgi:ribosome biogenesis GTPase A